MSAGAVRLLEIISVYTYMCNSVIGRILPAICVTGRQQTYSAVSYYTALYLYVRRPLKLRYRLLGETPISHYWDRLGF